LRGPGKEVLKELKGGYSFENEDSRPNFLPAFELARVLVRLGHVAHFNRNIPNCNGCNWYR